MNQAAQQLHIVALSALAPGRDASAFGRMAQQARQRSSRLGISGVLLFDGQRCCLLMHGEAEALRLALAARAEDAHFEPPCIVLQTSLPAGAFSTDWRTGYVDADAIDMLLRGCEQGADTAFTALAAVLAGADLDVPPPVAAADVS